jgi:reactive intermediate/imine deaminase
MAIHNQLRRGTVRRRVPAVVVGPVLAALTLSAAAGCRRAAARLQYFPTPVAPGRPAPPFSQAVRAGGLLALAGQLGTDDAGRLVPGGVEAETRQALENVRAALARAGASMDDVVTCTVLLADVADRDRMSRVYATYFRAGRLPARTAFGTGGLALGARVEIECWAATR